jgi:hypothetical protein
LWSLSSILNFVFVRCSRIFIADCVRQALRQKQANHIRRYLSARVSEQDNNLLA